MTEVALLIPVRQRPHRVKPLLESIEATTTVPHRTIFIADVDDEAEIKALFEADAEWFGLMNKGYAAKINAGVQVTSAPYIFAGADDLEFQPGWFEEAKAAMNGGVVGVNDLIRRKREHATHFLLTREYAARPTADGGRGPFCEEYHHWWCDNELIATARSREAYVYAPNARVRHLHPYVRTAPNDATYEHGASRKDHDRRLFNSRRKLWASRS